MPALDLSFRVKERAPFDSSTTLAAGGRSARELDLPGRFSVGHIVDSEHEWRAHGRACEPQLRLERERGQGVARTRQVVALKSSPRLVLARA